MDNIPEKVAEHLRGLIASSSLKDRDDAFEVVAENWKEKLAMFEAQASNLDMIQVDKLAEDDPRAALMLTFSGSLISLGYGGEKRKIEYASIKLRTDVPGIVRDEAAVLAKPPKAGEGLEFSMGPVQKTSPVYAIAVTKQDVSPTEQDVRIREATIFLTNGFMQVNQTLALPEEPEVDRFTLNSMVNYLAKKHGFTQKQTKEIIDDFLILMEAGMLLGENVSLGRLGKLSLKTKAAQKARVIRNPQTGEDMTVPAKAEHMVPVMRFSSGLKERAQLAPVEKDDNSPVDVGQREPVPEVDGE
ncbi:MAG: HU family DNA-binding protein [Spirochaetia bacterium]